MRTDGYLLGSILRLKKPKAFWNAFLLFLILVYNLSAPTQSLAGFIPLASGYQPYEHGVDSDRVNTPTAHPAAAACPQASCAYLPLLSSSLPVRVVEAKFSLTRAGTYRCIGDVTAIFGYPVYNVKVKLRFFDSAGQLIGESTGPTAFPATLPGQLNPFHVGSNLQYDWKVTYEAVIAGFDQYSPIVYAPATVITTTEALYLGTRVNALIRNDGLAPLTDVQAVAWSLDQYYGYDLEKVADILLPGETVTYTKDFFYTFSPSFIKVAAQGILQP